MNLALVDTRIRTTFCEPYRGSGETAIWKWDQVVASTRGRFMRMPPTGMHDSPSSIPPDSALWTKASLSTLLHNYYYIPYTSTVATNRSTCKTAQLCSFVYTTWLLADMLGGGFRRKGPFSGNGILGVYRHGFSGSHSFCCIHTKHSHSLAPLLLNCFHVSPLNGCWNFGFSFCFHPLDFKRIG